MESVLTIEGFNTLLLKQQIEDQPLIKMLSELIERAGGPGGPTTVRRMKNGVATPNAGWTGWGLNYN